MTEGTREQTSGASGTRAAAWLAWSLAGLSVAMFVTAGTLSVLARPVQSPGDLYTIDTVSETVSFVLFLGFPIVGALVTSRRPRNLIGWIVLTDGLLWTILAVTDSYGAYGAARPGSVPFPVAISTTGNQSLWVPTVGLLGIYLILLFPDGKLLSRRWLPLAFFSRARSKRPCNPPTSRCGCAPIALRRASRGSPARTL